MVDGLSNDGFVGRNSDYHYYFWMMCTFEIKTEWILNK